MHIDGITLGYAGSDIVSNVSLTIPAGSVTAIIGPNGCGKSTLLRGMSRLLRPRSGRVLLDGDDIAGVRPARLARRLALLPQGPIAPEGLTVADLIARGRHPHRSWYQRWTDSDEAAVVRALERVDLADLAHTPVDELSGGQRQRAWLAMVLAQDTPWLLLDEPTTYLDLAHAVDMLRTIRSVVSTGGRSVVAVLHDLTLAARFADHVVVMQEGRIAATGQPAEILTEGLLARVFGLDAHVATIESAPVVVPRTGLS